MNTITITVAKSALLEAGRPDLAARVYSSEGWPAVRRDLEDNDVVVRAFWLAHLSTGHRASIASGPFGTSIECEDCSWGRGAEFPAAKHDRR